MRPSDVMEMTPDELKIVTESLEYILEKESGEQNGGASAGF